MWLRIYVSVSWEGTCVSILEGNMFRYPGRELVSVSWEGKYFGIMGGNLCRYHGRELV